MNNFGYEMDMCALAIVAGQAPKRRLDLSSLGSAFRGQYHELVAFLARRVEHHSSGTFTVRVADSDLFQPQGTQYIRLVRCSPGVPDGLVTELDENMMLIFVGPYADGVHMDVPRTSTEEVANRRRARAQREPARQREQQRSQLRESARPLANDFLVGLTEALRKLLQSHRDSELRAEFTQETVHGRALTLEAVAYYAKAAGVTVESLAR